MSHGHYRMHRGWMQNPVFQGEPFSRRDAWVWLIESAAWKPRNVDVFARTVALSRGQLCFSTRFLAAAWEWSESRVRRFLTRLKTDAMIDAATDAGQTLITICNYEKYQAEASDDDAPPDALPDAEVTQQRRKDKRRERKKDSYSVDFDEFWRVYPERKPHANPKKPAGEKFKIAVRRGVRAADIIRGAGHYAMYVERERVEPKFVAQATTWLNQERWEQYQETPPESRAVDDGFL